MFGEEMGLEDWDGISELRIFKVLLNCRLGFQFYMCILFKIKSLVIF